MSVLVGVDAGASHTEAVVAVDAVGAVTRRRGPGAALRPGHAEQTAAAIARVIRAALDGSGLGKDADAVVVGGAGTGRDEDREEVQSALQRRLGGASVLRVTTDGVIALESAFQSGPGMVLCAGSGSIAYARDSAGAVWRVGGLGWRFGDEGSGYALGRAALGAVGRAADGRGPTTRLSETIRRATSTESLDDMIRWTQTADRVAIAALARVVCDTARTGDAVAQELVEGAAADLVQHVRALAARFADGGPADLALGGGLLSDDSPVRVGVAAAIRDLVPGVRLVDLLVDPPMGALALAARLIKQ